MATKKSTTLKASAPNDAVRIRMFRHGLGDCFLLSFPKAKKDEHFHVLIDCGLIGVATNPKPTMQSVVQSISDATGNHLDLVILTHEHWDHASGFSTQQAQAEFDGIPVDQVWYAWTEDPGNKLGKKLRKEREDKVRAIHLAARQLNGVSADRVGSMLSFFGLNAATPLGAKAGDSVGKVRAAFDYMGQRKDVKVRYCYPTDGPLALAGVPGVRVYVLGPPENEGLIKRSDPTAKGKEVYELAGRMSMESHLAAAFSRLGADKTDVPQDNHDCPFEEHLHAKLDAPEMKDFFSKTWNRTGEEWRRIEEDWMSAAESLSLALDKHTNNTSLVVAFEFTQSGRVMLFCGDAQVGNWLSWQDVKWEISSGGVKSTVTGPDLLARTIFYKVGHHGSHNATLRDKGLEQMISPGLIAVVPVNVEQARKNRWMEMPFENLVKRLEKKTDGRVIVTDSAHPGPKGDFQKALTADPGGLFYDLLIPVD